MPAQVMVGTTASTFNVLRCWQCAGAVGNVLALLENRCAMMRRTSFGSTSRACVRSRRGVIDLVPSLSESLPTALAHANKTYLRIPEIVAVAIGFWPD
jgi:hypothetical protein